MKLALSISATKEIGMLALHKADSPLYIQKAHFTMYCILIQATVVFIISFRQQSHVQRSP